MQWHERKSDLNTTVLVMRSIELSRLCSVLKGILLGILIARDMLRISAEITEANTPVSIPSLARTVHAHLLSSLRLSLPAGNSRVVQDVEIGTTYRDFLSLLHFSGFACRVQGSRGFVHCKWFIMDLAATIGR